MGWGGMREHNEKLEGALRILLNQAESVLAPGVISARSVESRLAEVLSESDILGIILGRIAVNAVGFPVKA